MSRSDNPSDTGYITKTAVLNGIWSVALVLFGAASGWYLNQPSSESVQYSYQKKVDSRLSSLASSVQSLAQTVSVLNNRVEKAYPREIAERRLDNIEGDIDTLYGWKTRIRVEIKEGFEDIDKRLDTVQYGFNGSPADSPSPGVVPATVEDPVRGLPGVPDPWREYATNQPVIKLDRGFRNWIYLPTPIAMG